MKFTKEELNWLRHYLRDYYGLHDALSRSSRSFEKDEDIAVITNPQVFDSILKKLDEI